MNPKNYNILTSKLTRDELTVRLRKVIRTQGAYPSDKYLFKGKVNKVGFEAFSLPYSLNNHMMILKFKGHFIETNNKKTQIKLIVKPAIELQILFIAGIVINLTFIVYLYIKPILNEQFITWKLYSITLVITTLLFYIFFQRIKKSSIKVLKSKIFAEEPKML